MSRGSILGLLFATTCCAQTVQVYSEFARLSESGDPLAPENPREILSPAVPRNAFSTFQVAIQTPRGTKYNIYIGQNPVDAVKVTLYRRTGEKLEPVGLPYEGTSSQVLWMDVWVDAAAPVRRVKVEPQIYVNNDWLIYPMEVRVSEVAIPEGTVKGSNAEEFLCGAQKKGPNREGLQLRNTRQDVALLSHSSPAQQEAAKKALGDCSAPASSDPESYLHLRDLLSSPAWQKMREAAPPR
jgi:hypothetical protein